MQQCEMRYNIPKISVTTSVDWGAVGCMPVCTMGVCIRRCMHMHENI